MEILKWERLATSFLGKQSINRVNHVEQTKEEGNGEAGLLAPEGVNGGAAIIQPHSVGQPQV